MLQEPEQLDPNTFVILLCKRLVREKTYGTKSEISFKFPGKMPLIEDLVKQCKESFGLSQDEGVKIAKHVPHNFEWKWMNPDEECVEKRKKNKEVKFKAGEQDLRKFPFFLKDGDIIGVKLDNEDPEGTDDFQTEEDQIAKERFSEMKEEERKEREKNRALQQKDKNYHKEVSFQIYTEF